jgi:hypothetical protein
LVGDAPEGVAELFLVGGSHLLRRPLNVVVLVGVANGQVVFRIEQR